MDLDKILQAYVGQTEISYVKNFGPWSKGVSRKVSVFCNRYNEVVFLGNEQISMKFGQKSVNWCALLNLNRRIQKIFP